MAKLQADRRPTWAGACCQFACSWIAWQLPFEQVTQVPTHHSTRKNLLPKLDIRGVGASLNWQLQRGVETLPVACEFVRRWQEDPLKLQRAGCRAFRPASSRHGQYSLRRRMTVAQHLLQLQSHNGKTHGEDKGGQPPAAMNRAETVREAEIRKTNRRLTQALPVLRAARVRVILAPRRRSWAAGQAGFA